MTPLRTKDDWQTLKNLSKEKPVIILKHSNICPISGGAYTRVVEGIGNNVITEPVHLLIVQESRDLSNMIAQELGVQHESPQIIVMKDEASVYNESHHAITAEEIARYL